MDQFEKQFEDLDVHTSVLETAMGTATTTSTPASQVDELIKQVPLMQTSQICNCIFVIFSRQLGIFIYLNQHWSISRSSVEVRTVSV